MYERRAAPRRAAGAHGCRRNLCLRRLNARLQEYAEDEYEYESEEGCLGCASADAERECFANLPQEARRASRPARASAGLLAAISGMLGKH